jgi:tRNA U34 2-thiouridine synthase MnmA/TrmU
MGPWYVASKEAEKNTLYVTNNLELVDKPRVEFRVHRVNWVSGSEPRGLSGDGIGIELDMKLRHGPTLSKGTIIKDPVGEGMLRVVLNKRDKGIAPGQFAAFYRGSECLGAGVIADTAVDTGLGLGLGLGDDQEVLTDNPNPNTKIDQSV